MDLTNEAPVFRTTSYRDAHFGCPPTTRGQCAHPAGQNGRYGSTLTGVSVPMPYRSRGSGDVTGAESPALPPIFWLGGKPRSSHSPCGLRLELRPKRATLPI